MASPTKRRRIEETEGTSQSEGAGFGSDGNPAEQAAALLAASPTTSAAVERAVYRQTLQTLLNFHREPESQRSKEKSDLKREMDQLWEEVQKSKAEIEKLTKRPTKIATSSLTPFGALQAFGLEQATHHIEQVEVLEPPAWVLERHELVEKLVLSRATRGEAYARLLADPVIMAVLMNQNQRSTEYAQRHNQASPIPLRLVLEDHLQAKKTIRGDEVIVQGKTDYAIYYQDELFYNNDTNDTATSKFEAGIVAIEAKKSGDVMEAMAQLIAYMGMIYRERKKRRKDNCTVWGFASDGHEYVFARVDELGRFRKSMAKPFNETDRGSVFGTLCSMFDAAALSSPSTSPIKDREGYQKVLAQFRNPERAGQFDYGVSKDIFGIGAAPAANCSESGE